MNGLRENGHSMWSEEPEPEEQKGGSKSSGKRELPQQRS